MVVLFSPWIWIDLKNDVFSLKKEEILLSSPKLTPMGVWPRLWHSRAEEKEDRYKYWSTRLVEASQRCQKEYPGWEDKPKMSTPSKKWTNLSQNIIKTEEGHRIVCMKIRWIKIVKEEPFVLKYKEKHNKEFPFYRDSSQITRKQKDHSG